MKKTMYCVAALLVLVCGLSSCGQGEEGSQQEKSQLYAACDNYFNIDQTHEWDEMDTLLRGLKVLEEDQTYELGCLIGHLDSMSTRVSAYQALNLSAPDEIRTQLLPEGLLEAYSAYAEARSVFLAALQENSSVLADPDTQFRATLPGLIQGFEKVDLTLRQLRMWDDQARTAQYSEDLSAFAAQLEEAAALLA